MGEWSKKVGEAGERIASDFLHMIGWTTAQNAVELPCTQPERHKRGGAARRTHGIDYLTAQKSPLVDGVGYNIAISVKFSAKSYPPSPATTFKEHLTDLGQTLECFKHSEIRRGMTQTLSGVTRMQDVGVLLWLSNSRGNTFDLADQLARITLPDNINFDAICLVDNSRAQFVFDSINYGRRIGKDSEVEFFYNDTGKNLNPLKKAKHGPVLPIEHLNANVLALRISDRAGLDRTLLLASREPFSESAAKRLMGLSQDLSQGWCRKVVIAFPDYDGLHHGNTVQSAKNCFSDHRFVETVHLVCYDEDFRTISSQ